VIVIDASAMVDALLSIGSADTAGQRLLSSGELAHAPHLIDLEVTQVLRRRAMAGLITQSRGLMALNDLALAPLFRHSHDFLLPRVWELRHNFSAYDAVYVALAEFLNAPLLTRDRRLAAAPGHRARIDLV
jgi:predicted nucleic acid-binding protein